MIRSNEKTLVSIVGFIKLYGEVAASYLQCGAHRIHIQAVGASRELCKQGMLHKLTSKYMLVPYATDTAIRNNLKEPGIWYEAKIPAF